MPFAVIIVHKYFIIVYIKYQHDEHVKTIRSLYGRTQVIAALLGYRQLADSFRLSLSIIQLTTEGYLTNASI